LPAVEGGTEFTQQKNVCLFANDVKLGNPKFRKSNNQLLEMTDRLENPKPGAWKYFNPLESDKNFRGTII